MSVNIDSFTLAGLAFFGAGLVLTAYVALEPNSAPNASTRTTDRERPTNKAPVDTGAQAGRAGPGGQRARKNPTRRPTSPPASRTGWIPSQSRESVSARDIAAGLPSGKAGCSEQIDPVELGKQAGAVVAEQIRVAGRVPSAEERALGDKLERQLGNVQKLKGKLDLPSDISRYRSYLQALVDEMAQHSHRKGEIRYRIHIVRDKAFNAFALPGGVLAIHTGVLSGPAAVRDEAELMMVLGHEIAHVELRHPLAAYEAARAVLGSSAEEAAMISQMLQIPISSEYEHQADRRGIELAVLSQYDPGAAARLWRRRSKARPRAKLPMDILGKVLGSADRILATHPSNAHRCARTRSVAQEQARSPRWTRFYRGSTNLRDRVPGRRAPH